MLDELQHMLLVVRHGTITDAARHAHLTQPAMTAAVQRLEQHFGARLFDRGRQGAELTAAGHALLPRVEAALAAVQDGKRAVAEVMGLQAGQVRIGAGATACTYLLPETLFTFRRQHPGVRLTLREAFTDHIVTDLRRGALDLGIVTGDGDEPWLCDELVLVAAPDLAIGDAGFVTFGQGSPTRALLLEHFPDAQIVMELSSIAAVKGNVRAGIGIALVSRAAVAADLARGDLVEVSSPHTPIHRTLSVVHRGIERLPPAAARLRCMLLGEV